MKNITLESTDSTNKVAYKLALEGAEHGSSVMAKTQTAGRGRLGKFWVSVSGKGLYYSLILRPNLDLLDFSKVTLLAGLVVSDVLEDMYEIPIGLKWPNDLYVGGKKLGGILVESSPLNCEETDRFMVVGIGVNVNHCNLDFPEDIRSASTSLNIESTKHLGISLIIAAVQEKMLSRINEVEEKGFNEVLSDWKQKDVLIGKIVEMVNSKEEVVSGVALGIDNEGILQVRDTEGICHQILSGDVRLAQKRQLNQN